MSNAHSPEVNARRAATRAATMAAKKAQGNGHDAQASQRRAKLSATAKAVWKRRKANERHIKSIPLDAIPDDKPRKKYGRKARGDMSREQMALEIVRLTMLLAGSK